MLRIGNLRVQSLGDSLAYAEGVHSNVYSLLSGHSVLETHRKLHLDVGASYGKLETTAMSELRTGDGDKAPSSHLYIPLPGSACSSNLVV